MTVTNSNFDPMCLEQYQDPPKKLHFQWEGKRCDNYVYVYNYKLFISMNNVIIYKLIILLLYQCWQNRA